ncbi:MAG: tetratricopeptide repeat protein [Myxococcota bacterium]
MRWLTRAFGGNARAPRDVDSALRAALLAVLDRDHDRAEELLAAAVRFDPDDIDLYLALARLYRVRGETGRAIRVHQNLLLRGDLSPERRATLLCDLGADFVQGGYLRRAIASYDEVIASDKRHIPALRALVRLLPQVHELPRALELVGRLTRLDPGDTGVSTEAELYVKMAEAALAEENVDAARKAAKKALRKDKGSAAAWVVLGSIESARGRSKAALAAWSRVPSLDRSYGPLVYPLLYSTYAALDRPREFEALLEKLLKDQPDDAEARRTLAKLLIARDEIDSAVIQFRTLLEQDENDLQARAELGRLLVSQLEAGARLVGVDVTDEHTALIDALSRIGLIGTEKDGA